MMFNMFKKSLVIKTVISAKVAIIIETKLLNDSDLRSNR
jgi:hypothetical protein